MSIRGLVDWGIGSICHGLRSKRYASKQTAGPDRLECLHAAGGGSARQALGQLVLMGRVPGDKLQQEIAAAADHVALAHLWPVRNELLESGQHDLLLAIEPDNSEEYYL